jgi:soluble lytic murein transglycosylase-like protein
MLKDRLKFFEMHPNKIYQQYLWKHSKMEWVGLTIKLIMNRVKPLVLLFILSLPLTLTVNTLADGTVEKHWIIDNIKIIQSSLPQMEKAFNDIDSLRKSVSKVAYKDLDESFLYAFMIVKWAYHNNLDPLQVAAVIQTESEFNPKAVSKKDARGLMQVHKPTWKMQNYFDAEENVKKGAEILFMYKRDFPKSYLNRYSGGEVGYDKKVKNNEQKIKKNLKG